jgi:hypothetical protein
MKVVSVVTECFTAVCSSTVHADMLNYCLVSLENVLWRTVVPGDYPLGVLHCRNATTAAVYAVTACYYCCCLCCYCVLLLLLLMLLLRVTTAAVDAVTACYYCCYY